MTARILSLVVVGITALSLHAGPAAEAQTPAAAPPASAPAPKPAVSTPPKPRAVPPKTYASPEEAAEAFIAALRAHDTKALLVVFGSDSHALVSSGDTVADQQASAAFVQSYDTQHKLVATAESRVLMVGVDDYPFAIPIVKDGERWRFDPKQGREEILARRIGRNELFTIETCLAYVDAQREYYAEDRTGSGILEYAQKFASTPGKRDGLYWPNKPGEVESPLGSLVAQARDQGYRRAKSGPTPYHGYLYRILTSQGPAVDDGAYDYIVRGHMIAGFALVASPAEYGASGVMTFIVNQDGVVYQKDLGPNTHAMASGMKAYNPDSTWTKADIPD